MRHLDLGFDRLVALRDREPRTVVRTDVRGISVAEAMPTISRAVSRLDDGQVLEVLSSDPESVLVLLAWTYASSNPLLDVGVERGEYRFVIGRGDKPSRPEPHMLPAAV